MCCDIFSFEFSGDQCEFLLFPTHEIHTVQYTLCTTSRFVKMQIIRRLKILNGNCLGEALILQFNMPTSANQPGNVGLRDPGVSGRADVFSWTFILSSVAAAGLAVSLLTQGVREVVISGTQRQSDIETWKEQEEVTGKQTGKINKKKQNSANRSIFHICAVLLWQYLISVSCESARIALFPKVQWVRWVIFLGLSVF